MTNEKLRAVIIDDVESAIVSLTSVIADVLPQVVIVGTADGVVSGAKCIRMHQPDIVFLDIEMPDGSGFDLIDILPEDLAIHVVFTTGSEDYAIRAFRYAAVDYLLKPIDPDELLTSVQKIKSSTVTTQTIRKVMESADDSGRPSRLALHTSDAVTVVDINDIIRCQSLDNYCEIFLAHGEKILMSKPLKYYADLLEINNFIRVHQSHLVNMDYIHSFVKKEGGYLLLKDQTQVPVSMRRRADLLERLAG